MNIPPKARENIYRRFSDKISEWTVVSKKSVLSDELKKLYIDYFRNAAERLGLL